MRLKYFLILIVLSLFQTTSEEIDMFNFILIFLGIVLLIVILIYILLTSKQE